MFTEVPFNNKELHSQLIQTKVNEEEYEKIFEVPNPNLFLRILSFIFFILFL